MLLWYIYHTVNGRMRPQSPFHLISNVQIIGTLCATITSVRNSQYPIRQRKAHSHTCNMLLDMRSDSCDPQLCL